MPEQNIGLTKDELRTVLTVRYRNSDILNPEKVARETIAAIEASGVKFYEPPAIKREARIEKCKGNSYYPNCCYAHSEAWYNSPG